MADRLLLPHSHPGVRVGDCFASNKLTRPTRPPFTSTSMQATSLSACSPSYGASQQSLPAIPKLRHGNARCLANTPAVSLTILYDSMQCTEIGMHVTLKSRGSRRCADKSWPQYCSCACLRDVQHAKYRHATTARLHTGRESTPKGSKQMRRRSEKYKVGSTACTGCAVCNRATAYPTRPMITRAGFLPTTTTQSIIEGPKAIKPQPSTSVSPIATSPPVRVARP